MTINNNNQSISPRFRFYGDRAEFETELALELFFWSTVLEKLGLKPLKRQHYCREGICDILAKGTNNQLIIIELKNVKDSHVINQITSYFDALNDEKPFSDQIDYSHPIELYVVAPDYKDRTACILKYHRLDINILSYTVIKSENNIIFTLKKWENDVEQVKLNIPFLDELSNSVVIPQSPKVFQHLISRLSKNEATYGHALRNQIYQFSQNFNAKTYERVTGKSLRLERNKQNPIAEIGWDNKRNCLSIYLWLPFVTINGRWNRGSIRDSYKRTAMMQIFIQDGLVQYVGYVHKGSKSWVIITPDEFKDENIPKPTKLKKELYIDEYYWKGLAMPCEYYLKTQRIDDRSKTLEYFINLALEHSLEKMERRKKTTSAPCIGNQHESKE